MASMPLVLLDFILSFIWVWSGALIKLFVYNILGYGFEPKGEILKASLSILRTFFFAWLVKISRGGSYNPLALLSGLVSGNLTGFLFTIGVRIPAQVFGSVVGVMYIIETFPEIGHGPRLKVDIHRGALTEGFLCFAIVIVSQGLARSNTRSFFIRTWMSSCSKLTLHTLGSDLTGGCMNPATALAWAYARGDHVSKEHIFVYWIAPIQATLLGVWIFRLLVPSSQKFKEEKLRKNIKSD
ncbi:hypothetical protein NE237_017192 [Protea cynaroides]|uniref:Aquaporin SIP2-1 n=1 Tax=Protea cynaroides TaxID=273540 RepID=A0A9Q0K7J9_9MAGN|nr:hypothetical protein NE237_017192 [Protea cynaroides]